MKKYTILLACLLLACVLAMHAEEPSMAIPAGSKLFVAAMPDGFDGYIKAALIAKKVPLTIVEKREEADFEITGVSETQKAGTAKILITGSWHSSETASIKVANLKLGVVAYAYSYHSQNSAHGKKSSAEACAKHLKSKIEGGK